MRPCFDRQRQLVAVPLFLLLSAVGCAGKAQDDSVRAEGGSAGSINSSKPSAGGGSMSSEDDDPPPGVGNGPATGGNGQGGGPIDGQQFVTPDELEKQNEERRAAHQASPTCVDACVKLASVCDGKGFNDCDLDCPGPVAGDAKCVPLLEAAYRCLGDHSDEAIICEAGRDAHVRCGVCDDALRSLAQGCDLKIECAF